MLNVTLAPPRRKKSLTIFPLLAADAPQLPYALMADALRHGVLRITEIGQGTVPELLAINGGDSVVLVLDGEQLVGARQNRTTNRSILLPAKSETKIPVSCMEQGRWHFDSDQFTPTEMNSPSSVRRHARDVEAGYARAGAPAPTSALSGAQGSVWNTIAEHSAMVGAHSDTGALDHLYRSRTEEMELWIHEFPAVPNQVGLLAFIGTRPVGLDVIGSTDIYAPIHDRLLSGYVMDALGSASRGSDLEPARAQAFLDRVSAASRTESPTVGAGRYAVLSGEVVGGELTDGEALVHLSAFPAAAQPERGPRPYGAGPISPPSRRRGRG